MPRQRKSAALDLAALASVAVDTGARLQQAKAVTASSRELSALAPLIEESFKSGTARQIPVPGETPEEIESTYKTLVGELRKDAAQMELGLRQKLVEYEVPGEDDEVLRTECVLEFQGTKQRANYKEFFDGKGLVYADVDPAFLAAFKALVKAEPDTDWDDHFAKAQAEVTAAQDGKGKGKK